MESARLDFFQPLLQPGFELVLEVRTAVEVLVGNLDLLAGELAGEEEEAWWPWRGSPCPASPGRSQTLTAKERNRPPGELIC